MKIAVTGASGHIGSEVCRALLKRNYQVKALVRNDTKALESLPIEKVTGSITDLDSLRILLKDCEAVMHIAGKIELSYHFDASVYETNVLGTENVLKIAREMGVRKMVYFSSIEAYAQHPLEETIDEKRDFVADESTFYGRTKRDAQQMVLASADRDFEVCVVCPTAVVGPPDHKLSKLGKAVKDIYQGKIPATVKGGFDFVDVRDIALGSLLALEKGRPGETYILGGKYYSLKEFTEMVLQIKGKPKNLLQLPLWMAYLGLPFIKIFVWLTREEPLYDKIYLDILKNGNPHISSEKAKQELGYTSRSLEESLRDLIQWFKENNVVK